MATKRDFSGFPQLQTLAERLREWRSTRPLGERIPAELWQAATEAARTHGVGTTAAALYLDYYDPQRRLLSHPVGRKPAPAPPRFVELVAPAVPLEAAQSSWFKPPVRDSPCDCPTPAPAIWFPCWICCCATAHDPDHSAHADSCGG